MILLPSKNRYLEFKNIRNTIQHNFIIYADIESYMDESKTKNIYNHKYLMSGYYLDCLDEYSKKVQLFDKLNSDSLINELDYIENINEMF